jgi:hypothetical protein
MVAVKRAALDRRTTAKEIMIEAIRSFLEEKKNGKR